MGAEGHDTGPDAPIIETLAVGSLAANCYLFICSATLHAVIIDPGDEAERILRRVRDLGARVTHILHTHGHFDHISATEAVLAGLPEAVHLGSHPADAYLYRHDFDAIAASLGYPVPAAHAGPDLALEAGAEVQVGSLRLQVMHTPGHTPGSISLFCPPWCVLTGDTLFRRGIGRTDLAGGDEDALYSSIVSQLHSLDPSLVAYPGHGPRTTIDEERRLNPFVRG
jgi:hydroxyacylglutathione hydrolase